MFHRFAMAIVTAAPLFVPHVGAAQGFGAAPTAGPYARLVVIEPRPEQREAFEAGYRRHLEWHRSRQDTWTWHGWSFVLGERLGLFMDGTFGHAPGNFDRAVDPAGDAADNAANVAPYADFLSHGVYRRLDSLSTRPDLPDTSRFLALATYWVRPGFEARFEAAIASTHAHLAQLPHPPPYAWFRLAIGGSQPEYLLFRPASSWAAAAELPDFFAALDEHGGSRPLEGVARVRSELLRYRADMSYRPRE